MAISTLEQLASGDGARQAAIANTPTPSNIGATWRAAQTLYGECRHLSNNVALEVDWAKFFNQRGGLGPEAEMRLAEEAFTFFKSKRAEIDAYFAAARKAEEDRNMEQRLAQVREVNRRTLVETELAALFAVAANLREMALAIDGAKGSYGGSIYGHSAPAIADDNAVIELCAGLTKKLTEVAAALKHVSGDAAARLRPSK